MSDYNRMAIELRDTWAQGNPDERTVSEMASDTLVSAAGHIHNFGAQGRMVIGKVISATPYLHWYRVSLEDGDGDYPCCRMGISGTLQPLGQRDVGMIPPDNDVLVYKHRTLHYGIILGPVPSIMQDGSLAQSDWVSQGGNTGFKREGYHHDPLSILYAEGGAIDFSSSRPLDSTIFDQGQIDELGGRLICNQFLKQFAIDEQTGLYLFYDQLARLSGRHLDIRSAVTELRVRDDEGRSHIVYGEALFPYEALGKYKSGSGAGRENSDYATQYEKPEAKYEPSSPTQAPFYRYRTWGGILGQGHLTQYVAPPKDAEGINELDGDPPITLYQHQILPNGAGVWSSAKSLTFVKKILLPTVVEKHPPEDRVTGGDNDLAEELDRAPLEVLGALGTRGAIIDLHAHLLNWRGVRGFHDNDDYNLPEQGDSHLEKYHDRRTFSELKTRYSLSAPEAKTVKLTDDVNTKVIALMSKIHMDEDGSIIIGDGNSAQIVLAGGHAFLQAPGDIVFQPGRNLVALAGQDVNLRAHDSVDISAATADLRLKADKNMQLLAGNSGDGVLLVENKATDDELTFKEPDSTPLIGEDVRGGGIVFKAANTHLTTITAGVYMRTGSTDGEVKAGDIVFDADKGKKDIKTVSKTFERRARTSMVDIFGLDQVVGVNTWTQSSALIATPIQLGGGLYVADTGITVRGNVTVVEGSISGERADGRVGVVTDLTRDRVKSAADQIISLAATDVSSKNESYKKDFTEGLYAAEKRGNGEVQKSIGFSFRNEEQYGTTEFQMLEAEWQQLQRLSGDTGATWTEPVVAYQGFELMPYPGVKKWRDESLYYTIDTALFDVEAGHDKDRDIYADAQIPTPEPHAADGTYPIIGSE